jgi:hypothetical protein
MYRFIICPLAPNGERILTQNLVIEASSSHTAKLKAEMEFPGAAEYNILDIEVV